MLPPQEHGSVLDIITTYGAKCPRCSKMNLCEKNGEPTSCTGCGATITASGEVIYQYNILARPKEFSDPHKYFNGEKFIAPPHGPRTS